MIQAILPGGIANLPFFLQAVTFAMFWIMIPPKRRWRDSVCIALCVGLYILMYVVHNLFPSLSIAMLDGTSVLRFAAMMGVPIGMMLLVSGVVCVDTWPRRLLMSINMAVVFLLSEIVMEVIQVYVIRQPMHTTLGLWTMQILCPIVSLAFTAISATFWNHMDARRRRRIVLLALALAISQCACMYGMEVWNREALGEKMMIYFGVLVMLSVMADIVLYQLITRAIVARREQMEMQQLREKQEIEYYYYHMLRQRAEEQAKFRHDFKNQIQVLYTLLCSGERERSEELLASMQQRLDDSEMVSYTALPVVSAIINAWAGRAENGGLTLETDIDARDWRIQTIDQYVLFDRLLRLMVQTGRTDAPDPQLYLTAFREETVCTVQARWRRRRLAGWSLRQLNEKDSGEAEWQCVRNRLLKQYQGTCDEDWDEDWYLITLSLWEKKR